MHGPDILADFLTSSDETDKYGNSWQYNSRSDRHSKVGCWGVAFDLLLTSALLRDHVSKGMVTIGVNHSMTDFLTHRRKKLDLVFARPSGPATAASFKGLRASYGIGLTAKEISDLNSLPDASVAPVGAVLIALEAKAAMTAHVKALPRLYDELNSSHLCVHGASAQAIAIGYVQVNAAGQFASSVVNNRPLDGDPPQVTSHTQPKDVLRVIKKIGELPRRTTTGAVGFDGIGMTVLRFENRGGPVEIVDTPPAPQRGDAFFYDDMIIRMANEYDSRFATL